MEEDNMARAHVRCLSDVVGLQNACQTASLRFSAETNKFLVYQTLHKLGPSAAQKLVSKMVDDGFIKWEEDEDFEVECVLDHADDEGKRYYLIKWQGWSHFHNSWEPADNLRCPTIVNDYMASYKGTNSKLPVKRSVPKIAESAQISKRRKVDEIFHKLWCSPMSSEMSPLKLLTMHNKRLQTNAREVVHKGLVPSHDRFMRPKFPTTAPNYANTKKKVYKLKKAEIQAALKDWERKLNSINSDPAPILIENDIDLEGPPENFVYINDYRAGEGIEIPQDPIIGCECESCFEEKKSCCGTACGSEFAYYRWKRLRVPRGTPIYECNKRCKCGPDCPNRVVQMGRKIKVCIFRTANSRGWGVKTMQKIKKGSFVMEYVGEVITNEEAERRGKVYDAECRTYLFDLDYNDGDCPFTVDAGYYGNVSHFVNHSCEPNLVVFGVWINTLDPRLPRICLFADRDIDKGEELTFDYMMTGDTTQQHQNMSGLGFSLQKSPGVGSADISMAESTDTSIAGPTDISTVGSTDIAMAGSTDIALTDGLEAPLEPGTVLPLGTRTAQLQQSTDEVDGQQTSPQAVSPVDVTVSHDAVSPLKGQKTPPGSPAKVTSSLSPSKGARTLSDSPSKGTQQASSEDKRNEKVPAQTKIKYRMICQCGSTKCRKYLF